MPATKKKGPSKAELVEKAKSKGVVGTSRMNKDQLKEAIKNPKAHMKRASSKSSSSEGTKKASVAKGRPPATKAAKKSSRGPSQADLLLPRVNIEIFDGLSAQNKKSVCPCLVIEQHFTHHAGKVDVQEFAVKKVLKNLSETIYSKKVLVGEAEQLAKAPAKGKGNGRAKGKGNGRAKGKGAAKKAFPKKAPTKAAPKKTPISAGGLYVVMVTYPEDGEVQVLRGFSSADVALKFAYRQRHSNTATKAQLDKLKKEWSKVPEDTPEFSSGAVYGSAIRSISIDPLEGHEMSNVFVSHIVGK
jgi:hypothetical protein